ncbi:12622_t:CDS:2, partial [Acaulospora morrowiae]
MNFSYVKYSSKSLKLLLIILLTSATLSSILIHAYPTRPKIHITSPGQAPLVVDTQHTISWWSAGIPGNPRVTAGIYQTGNNTALTSFIERLDLNTVTFTISSDWSLTSTYHAKICILKQNPPLCSTGPTFRITTHEINTP